MRVLDVISQLESGRYPPCEWVSKAPGLAIGFFTYQPKYAPDSITRLVAAYVQFARPRLSGNLRHPEISYFLTTKLAEILSQQGDVAPAMERVFERLADDGAPEPSIRYLRATFYLRPTNGAAIGVGNVDRAVEALTALRAHGGPMYEQYTLGALAGLHFFVGDFARARESYVEYFRLYGNGASGWVAGLRIGQLLETMGQVEAAASAYRLVAERYGSVPPARALGFAFAARLHETSGDLNAALAEYSGSLAAWDDDYGARYELVPVVQPGRPFNRNIYIVEKPTLEKRVTQLTASLSLPDGGQLERGRVLLRGERYDEAVAALTAFLDRPRDAAVEREARALMNDARLRAALALANIESPAFDESRALQQLDALAGEPHDLFVGAARIAAACIIWKRGDARTADARMEEELKAWKAEQDASLNTPPTSPLEREVAAIRTVLVNPSGLPLLKKHGWNAFSWPAQPSRFLVVNPEVRVVAPGQAAKTLTVRHPIGTFDNVLFMTSEQHTLLARIVATLGGTKTRTPGAIMETPNQPIGPSLSILEFLNRFFPSRPGHWGGWEFETYPVVSSVEFLNGDHTRAAAAVTIGYSGATVVLRKENGRWVAVDLVNHWVT